MFCKRLVSVFGVVCVLNSCGTKGVLSITERKNSESQWSTPYNLDKDKKNETDAVERNTSSDSTISNNDIQPSVLEWLDSLFPPTLPTVATPVVVSEPYLPVLNGDADGDGVGDLVRFIPNSEGGSFVARFSRLGPAEFLLADNIGCDARMVFSGRFFGSSRLQIAFLQKADYHWYFLSIEGNSANELRPVVTQAHNGWGAQLLDAPNVQCSVGNYIEIRGGIDSRNRDDLKCIGLNHPTLSSGLCMPSFPDPEHGIPHRFTDVPC